MSVENPIQAQRVQSAAPEQGVEELQGVSKSPPPFQLLASPVTPAQQKASSQIDGASEAHDHDGYQELNPAGEFPWDAIVQLGEAKLQKNPTGEATEVLGTIPNGTILVVRAERSGYYEVSFGTKRGFVNALQLQKLSFRISKNEQLMNVMRGGGALKRGDRGAGVGVIQQLLGEISTVIMTSMRGTNFTGELDLKTEEILKAIQKDLKIPQTGCIDQLTVSKLNDFLLEKGYSLEGLELKGLSAVPKATEGVEYNKITTPATLLEGTRKISADEETAFKSAISTEAKAVGGVDPTFVETVGDVKYGKRIEEFLDQYIPAMYDRMAKGKQALRTDASNLHDWGQIEEVAKESKKATDQQFGAYRRGPALSSVGLNARIKDAWENKEKELKADPTVADGWVNWRVQKLLDGHAEIKAIDQLHGAVQSRAVEKGIISPIKAKMMRKYRKELIETHKAWPAFADEGNVFIQRFKEKDVNGNDDKAKGRDYMWNEFRTIIHEYIHTLEHTEHQSYRGGLGSKKGGFTLREGTTDYFTKIAYNNTNKADAALRKKIEGPFNELGIEHTLPNLSTYGESQNAEAAAGVIGFPNMCAAFFLGRTDLYSHS
jgi:hypothetical protein